MESLHEKTCGYRSCFACKKRPNVFSFEILELFGANNPFKKDDVQQK
jgi:hypothetical protein